MGLSNVPYSKDVERKTLIGMLASLRGCLYDCRFRLEKGVNPDDPDDKDLLEDIALHLNLTAINLSDEDSMDGGFDKSWFHLPDEST